LRLFQDIKDYFRGKSSSYSRATFLKLEGVFNEFRSKGKVLVNYKESLKIFTQLGDKINQIQLYSRISQFFIRNGLNGKGRKINIKGYFLSINSDFKYNELQFKINNLIIDLRTIIVFNRKKKYKKLLKQAKKISEETNKYGFLLLNIQTRLIATHFLRNMHQFQDAIKEFDILNNLIEKLSIESFRIKIYMGYAGVFYFTDLNLALHYNIKILQLLKSKHDYSALALSYRQLYIISKKLGNFQEANRYRRLHKMFKKYIPPLIQIKYRSTRLLLMIFRFGGLIMIGFITKFLIRII